MSHTMHGRTGRGVLSQSVIEDVLRKTSSKIGVSSEMGQDIQYGKLPRRGDEHEKEGEANQKAY